MLGLSILPFNPTSNPFEWRSRFYYPFFLRDVLLQYRSESNFSLQQFVFDKERIRLILRRVDRRFEDSDPRGEGILLIYAPRGNFSRSLSPLLSKNSSEDRLIGACISGTNLASRMFRVPCNFVGSRRLSPVGSDIKIPRLGRKGGFSAARPPR